MINVQNISKRAFTFNLRHGADYGEGLEAKPHTQMIDRTGRDGVAGHELREVALPQSITLNAGEEKALPEAVAAIPEVQRARLAGILRITTQEPAAPAIPVHEDLET
jgi:hypothetical protein